MLGGNTQSNKKKQGSDSIPLLAEKGGLAELASNLTNLCSKEYTRRLSGQHV